MKKGTTGKTQDPRVKWLCHDCGERLSRAWKGWPERDPVPEIPLLLDGRCSECGGSRRLSPTCLRYQPYHGPHNTGLPDYFTLVILGFSPNDRERRHFLTRFGKPYAAYSGQPSTPRIEPLQNALPAQAGTLYDAAWNGSLSQIQGLVRYGASVVGAEGYHALCTACRKGFTEIALFLLEKGAPVNWPGATTSPLFESLGHKYHPALVQELLHRDAFVNFKTAEGWTPLIQASTWGWIESVRLLIEGGADPDYLTVDGKTALFFAIDNLLRDRLFRTAEQPFHTICDFLSPKTDLVAMFETAILRNQLSMMEWLIARLPVNVRLNGERTGLILATTLNRSQIVRRLIAQKADVNLGDRFGRTSLMEASALGGSTIIRLLLNQGCDVNARDNLGRTALLDAIRQGHKRAVKLLLRAHADPTLKSQDGSTAISIARTKGLESWLVI
jgi:uncharacterized protein